MVPGDIFAEKFYIKEVLGKGGSGFVYLAENMKLGSLWAIKEVPSEKLVGKHCPGDANILKKLEHRALPRVYDIFEENGNVYFIIDYIEGTSLDKLLAEAGALPEKTVIEWAAQLCDVLAYLHSLRPNPVIYRDIKPSNIILTKSGILKLVDFGTAREFKEHAASDTVFIGTRGYAAPEQYGKGQSDFRTDIYSLGVTLHQLLTGKGPCEPPYELKPVRYYNPELSESLEKIIFKCTRPDPAERYQNIQELWADIQAELGNDLNTPRNCNLIAKVSGEKYLHSIRDGTAGPKTFRRLVLTVWGNPEQGCELAYMAARKTGLSVLLVDLDLLAPKADLYLNISKYSGKVLNEGILGDSGLNTVIEAADRNLLTHNLITEVAVRYREAANLFILTGNYKLENYEYFSDESLLRLINTAYSSFDITVLLAGKWIYDSYTVLSLAKSDYNLVPVPADIDKIREFNNYIAFLESKQKISPDKYKFIAYEFKSGVNLTPDEVERAVQGHFAGCIRHSRQREQCRNGKKAYAVRMEKEVQEDYVRLLQCFGIVPRPGFKDLLIDYVNKFSGALKKKELLEYK